MTRFTKTLLMTLGSALCAGTAMAAGPLYVWQDGDEVKPLLWDTSNGPIPVYTDGGPAALDGSAIFTRAGNTPGTDPYNTSFISIERANEITQTAFDQWNKVETSTFQAEVVGTIESVTGIADVTGENAFEIYGVENGYGFFINYDTDGDILENVFGVPRNAVLGIAFPEWADEATGEITEATAVINGWLVYANDTNGDQVAGVFTHEFGHAINLSHSQVNGNMAYNGFPDRGLAPGPLGCGLPAHLNYRTNPRFAPPGTVVMDPDMIEIMYPFIDTRFGAGAYQAEMSVKDDAVGLSNLYPTPGYASDYGSISGTLRLKDGKTEYSGINIIARNVADPYYDAVSAQSGNRTQGLIGPDGSFKINGLTPGAQYEVYTEQISSGGYPTTRTRLVSAAEYWNFNEAASPAVDNPCDSTPITAAAGSDQKADLIFNGYLNGIQYRPIVDAFLTDLSKNGRKAAGYLSTLAFHWDINGFLQDSRHPADGEDYGFRILPAPITANNGRISRTGDFMTIQFDDNGNGIGQASLFDFTGKAAKGNIINLGDLNDDTCGGSGTSGTNSSYGWDVDDAGKTVVGIAYIDSDGDGFCQVASKGEILPFIWTDGKKNGGMRQLPIEGAPSSFSWVRAHAVSGNGKVVLGSNGGSNAVAWVNEGDLINLRGMFNAREAYAVSQDGSRVAMQTYDNVVVLWNPYTGESSDIGGLRWCRDLPYNHFFFGNLCERFGEEFVNNQFGPVPVLPLDMNDDGNVIVGRAGSFFTGFVGGIWMEELGWMTLKDFFAKQGVAEAGSLPMDNPIAMDGSGDTLVGGLAGITSSWHVDMREVFVCKNGNDIATDFPVGMIKEIEKGAEFGRCAHL